MLSMKALAPVLIPLATLGGLLLARALRADDAPDPNKPIPNPQTNLDTLRTQLATLLAQAAANPTTVDPDAMETLAIALDQNGLNTEAAQLRAAEAHARGAQGPHGGGVFIPPPGGVGVPAPPPVHAISAADQATFARYTDPTQPPVPAYLIDIFATKLQRLGFPAQAHTLRLRAMDVRATQKAGGLPADTHEHAKPRPLPRV